MSNGAAVFIELNMVIGNYEANRAFDAQVRKKYEMFVDQISFFVFVETQGRELLSPSYGNSHLIINIDG